MKTLREMIDESNYTVFFGGAGVSTESGIPDFRSVDGLYSMQYDYPPEIILSHSFFIEKTEEFYCFYREKMLCPSAHPNSAHKALAALEESGKLRAIITQNIDNLHQLAGSRNVYELHGSVWRNYCMKCGKFYGLDYIMNSTGIPKCDCSGIIKPDVVLYEEGLDEEVLQGACSHIMKADTLIVAGTSLTVYPAAGLVRYFKGKNLILINRDPTPMDDIATLVLREKVGEVLSEFMR